MPALAAVSPAYGLQGAGVQVTLTGANFFPGSTVATNNSGITVGNVTRVSLAQMLVTLTIAADARLGGSDLTVANSAGVSAPARFTVNPPAPTLAAVNPAAGLQGDIVPVTLSGTSFGSGSIVSISDPLVAVMNVRVVSSTQITATLAVGARAAVGPANITVTTGAGTSNPATFTVGVHETIPPSAAPTGPASGISGTLYQYTASPATSSLGHVVQYSFDWGDGSRSGWTPQGVTSSFHAWTAPGTYIVAVQARCMTDTAAVSALSAALTVIVGGESVSAPVTPGGPATAVTGTAAAYSTGGATSSLGHQIQYKFFWGDGSTSPWLAAGVSSASHTWFGSGVYSVTAQARCITDTQVISPVSTAFAVTVSAGETISTPRARAARRPAR